MRALLHLLNETTSIDIDLPEAQALKSMRARLDVYSNITHTRWVASTRNATAEVISTTPDPRGTLAKLLAHLRDEVSLAASTENVH